MAGRFRRFKFRAYVFKKPPIRQFSLAMYKRLKNIEVLPRSRNFSLFFFFFLLSFVGREQTCLRYKCGSKIVFLVERTQLADTSTRETFVEDFNIWRKRETLEATCSLEKNLTLYPRYRCSRSRERGVIKRWTFHRIRTPVFASTNLFPVSIGYLNAAFLLYRGSSYRVTFFYFISIEVDRTKSLQNVPVLGLHFYLLVHLRLESIPFWVEISEKKKFSVAMFFLRFSSYGKKVCRGKIPFGPEINHRDKRRLYLFWRTFASSLNNPFLSLFPPAGMVDGFQTRFVFTM